jgi:hypothetical protein
MVLNTLEEQVLHRFHLLRAQGALVVGLKLMSLSAFTGPTMIQ